jgi:hypothetical protein
MMEQLPAGIPVTRYVPSESVLDVWLVKSQLTSTLAPTAGFPSGNRTFPVTV